MNDHHTRKITASHPKRDAYLYVRQSTIRQVFENTESTRRQRLFQPLASAYDCQPGTLGQPNPPAPFFPNTKSRINNHGTALMLLLRRSSQTANRKYTWKPWCKSQRYYLPLNERRDEPDLRETPTTARLSCFRGIARPRESRRNDRPLFSRDRTNRPAAPFGISNSNVPR